MDQTVERIDKEIKNTTKLMASLACEENIDIHLLSDLIRVTQETIFKLINTKDAILVSMTSLESEEYELKISGKESIFIRSKTDGDWILVHSIEFLEKAQIFTTEEGQKIGEEYELISYVIVDNVFQVKVKKVKG